MDNEPPRHAGVCRWKVTNLLVAGRRVEGETCASSPEAAARNVAARKARELKVDVATAIAGAAADPYKKVVPLLNSSTEGAR